MKKNFCLFLGALLATSVIAQTNTNVPPPSGHAPKVDGKPATKPVKKSAPKKKAANIAAKPVPKKSPVADELRSIPLVAGPAVVIASNVNVRGRSGLIGEVVARLHNGDTVTVIKEITLKKSAEFEPSAWAKIVFPASAHVWVHSSFIDAATKTVKPKKLNLRGGPGENYSVIGTIEKGATVKEVSVKGDWLAIEAPAEAFAFVAAQYLKQEAPAIVAATPKPAESAPIPTFLDPWGKPYVTTVPKSAQPAPNPTLFPDLSPTPTSVAEPAPIATTTTEPPAVTPAPPVPAPAPVAVNPAPAVEEPLPPRVIQHEGIVKGTVSIQAPTKFALVNPDTGKTVNYLYTTSTNLDLHRYKGLHIVVTGEEGLDERWRNTPVITIQRIQVID